MKVLFLLTRPPVPPWRGDQVRAYHHLRLLAQRHEITCALITSTPPSAEISREIEALGVSLHVIKLRATTPIRAAARVFVGDRRPFQVLLKDDPRARRAVESLMASAQFDVVHGQLVRTAGYLPSGSYPPAVVDMIDALSSNLLRRSVHDRFPLSALARLEAGRLRDFEPALIDRADRTLVASVDDAEALGGAGVDIVTNGVELPEDSAEPSQRSSNQLLFAGNLGYFPNVDAARWLVDDIVPRVRSSRPDVLLRLVGARPSLGVRRMARREWVSLAANVPRMEPELSRAALTVIPVRSGTGVQNKALEAMANSTAVVTTPQVARAIGAEHGEVVMVGSDAAELADAVLTLLNDVELATKLGESGRQFVERQFRWESSADLVEAAWQGRVT